MALAATTVWEANASGSSLNGGGFNSAASGTDRSQGTTAYVDIDGSVKTMVLQATTTDVLLGGSSPHTVSSADIGNIVYISSGALTAGHYEIIAVNTGTNVWTLDRSAGASAGLTGVGKMGGCKAHPIDLYVSTGPLVAGNIVWCKGSFTINATMSVPAIASVRFVGYGTTRGDGTRSVWTTSGTSITQVQQNSASALGWVYECIKFDGGGATSARGLNISGGSAEVINCGLTRFANNAVTAAALVWMIGCEVTANTVTTVLSFTGSAWLEGCRISGNTSSVLSGGAANRLTLSRCLFYDNTGASNDLVTLSSATSYALITGCTFDSAGRHAINTTCPYGVIANNLITNSGGYGITTGATNNYTHVRNNAFYNNASGETNGFASHAIVGSVSLTGDPYTNRSGDDYSLDATSGEGGACRAAGYPTTLNSISTSRNIGAFDVAAGGSSGGLLTGGGMSGGARG